MRCQYKQRRYFADSGPRFKICQFIEGEPAPDDECKCGEPVVEGQGPYCPEHLARCYHAGSAV